MVTNAELESQFKAFSQDYKGAKKTLNLLCEKVNSIETKLEDLPAMRGEFNKLSAIILSKFSTETNFDQDPKFPKSGPSTAPVFPSNSRPFSSTSSVVPRTGQVPPQQTQPNIVFPLQGAGYMEGNQPHHPSSVRSYGEPRLSDADRGVKLEVSDFYGESNPEVFFDWLHSIESYFGWYSLSEERKLFFTEAKLKGTAGIWWEKYQQTHYIAIRSWEDMRSAMTRYSCKVL